MDNENLDYIYCQFGKNMQRKGASLFEMVASLAILGILIGFASISFVNPSPKYRLLTAVREIQSQMNSARYKAIRTGTKVRVRFKTNGFCLETWGENEEKWIPGHYKLIRGAQVEANNTPTFHSIGTVSNLCTINIFNTWGHFKISLAISGRIKIKQVEPLS